MISDAQIKQYNEEGYTIVENVFSMDELNPILNEFEEIVAVSYTHLTLPTSSVV